jgi:hypothetical protein
MTAEELKQLIERIASACGEDIFFDAKEWGEFGLAETQVQLHRDVATLSKWAEQGLVIE